MLRALNDKSAARTAPEQERAPAIQRSIFKAPKIIPNAQRDSSLTNKQKNLASLQKIPSYSMHTSNSNGVNNNSSSSNACELALLKS